MNSKQFDPSKSLYIQIKDKIREQILSGKFKENEKIPSERELCKMFEVSRITVRQAIGEAINEGLLFTVQGKGTFVANNEEAKIEQGLMNITSFYNTIASKGLLAGTKVLNHDIFTVDFALSKILDIDMTSNVLNLNLIGTADNAPIVLYQSYFEKSIGIKMYEEAEKKEELELAFSTIDLYKELGNLQPAYVEQTFEALSASPFIADILQIEEADPLFLITSIIYTHEDKPIEYKKAYYRADKYKFHIKRGIL